VYNPAWPTEWHLQSVLMAWWDYLYTGDLESVEAQYDDLLAKTYLSLSREDGLISTRTGLATRELLESVYYLGDQFEDIVDWPPGTPAGEEHHSYRSPRVEGERDGYVFQPYNTVVNAFHYRAVIAMASLAEALNRLEDARMLRDRAQLLEIAFQTAFFDEDRGIYVDGIGTDHASLHANMFPLAFGLVPDEHLDGVVDFVRSRGMACSVYGAQFLLEGLFDAGAHDYALDLMTSDGVRSWLNMIRVGLTMTTEAWDESFKPNLTCNHAWGSAPANIIPRKLFGIEPIEPGFAAVRIRPRMGDLEEARLRLPTIRGQITASWKRDDLGVRLDVKIPANMRAELWMPACARSVQEAGFDVADHASLEMTAVDDGWKMVSFEAGEYSFEWTE